MLRGMIRTTLSALSALGLSAVLAAQHDLTGPVREADADARPAALRACLEESIATGANYSGQFAGLAEVDGIAVLLHDWTLSPPDGVTDRGPFRITCLRALRDVLGGEAPDGIRTSLRDLALDDFEPAELRQAAIYALAQFGDRELLKARLEAAEKLAAAEDVQRRAQGQVALAEIHYNTRDYTQSAAAYDALIEMHESGAIAFTSVPNLYYNAACSHALAGETDVAFTMLAKAFETDDPAARALSVRLIDTDMDIASLRADERFAALRDAHYGGTTSRPSGDK